MRTKARALVLLLAVTFLLTGCMRIESFIIFEKGLMTTSVDLYLSNEVLDLDEETRKIVADRPLKDLSAEDRARICNIYAEDEPTRTDDVAVTSREKGVDDKDRIICEVKSEPVKPTDNKLPYTVTYDEASGLYTVKGDLSKFLGNDENLDKEQLKKMGAEIAVNFVFPGKLTKYVIDGKAELPAGATLPDSKSIRFDLLATSAEAFTVEGLEAVPSEESSDAPILPWLLGISGVVLVGGVALALTRRRQSEDVSVG